MASIFRYVPKIWIYSIMYTVYIFFFLKKIIIKTLI